MGQAAAKLAAFCEALPELGSDVMGILLSANPAVVSMPPSEVGTGGEEGGLLMRWRCSTTPQLRPSGMLRGCREV